jgi:phage recombination protein Bet
MANAEPLADQDTGEIIDAETEDIPMDADATPARPTHMMTALPLSSDMSQWTDEQAALLDAAGLVQRKNGQAPSWAPRATVAAFLQQCARTGLDPIARQIYCIERAGKWQIQISIDGARLVAQRTGQYRGQTPAMWTGDGVTWVEVWLSKEPPAAARVGVYREGFAEPLYAVARWDSYAVYTTDFRTKAQKLAAMWAKMPDVMLSKVAEMLALRKAFPQDLSGLYSTEEMEQAGASTSMPALAALGGGNTEVTADVVHAPIPRNHGGIGQDPRTAAETPSTEPVGDARWIPWKKIIDEAQTEIQIQQVRSSAQKAGVLQFQVPGQDYRVLDYIVARQLEITGDPNLRTPGEQLPDIKDRLAAGLKTSQQVGA